MALRMLTTNTGKIFLEDHDFYVQSDTLLLAEVFKSFYRKCFDMYELDPVHLFQQQN